MIEPRENREVNWELQRNCLYIFFRKVHNSFQLHLNRTILNRFTNLGRVLPDNKSSMLLVE